MHSTEKQISPRWWLGFTLFGVALLVAPAIWDSFQLTLLLIQGLLALSLGIMWGQAGILSFGQSAFYGLGAYGYAIAALNLQDYSWGPLAAVFIALLVTALFAAALGALLFYGRINDVYLGVMTLVVTLLFFKFLNAAAGSEYVIGTAQLGGFNGIPGFPPLSLPTADSYTLSGPSLYVLTAVLLLLCWLGCKWLTTTAWGRTLAGIRENELRVQLLGYDARRYKTGIFTLSALLAALAGVLFASWAEIVTPGLFSLAQAAEVIIWVIVGGLGSWIGPVIGAIALGSVKTLLAGQSMLDNRLLLGAILIFAVLLLPRGVIPTLQDRFKLGDKTRPRRIPRNVYQAMKPDRAGHDD